MVTQEFDINIIPHGLPPRVEVDQYDTGLRTLIAHIYQDDTPLVMTDEYTYTVIGTKPSGTGFSYPATAENGAIVIDVTGQMTVVSGLVECGIIVWSGTDRVGTHRFNLWVQPSALTAETIIDSDDFGDMVADAAYAWMDEHAAGLAGLWVNNTVTPVWEQGTIGSSGGNTSSTTRLRSDFIRVPSTIPIDVHITQSARTCKVTLFRYASNTTSSYIENSANHREDFSMSFSDGDYIRFVIYPDDRNTMLPTENPLTLTVTTYEWTDTTLTKAQKAADAKAVGDAITRMVASSAIDPTDYGRLLSKLNANMITNAPASNWTDTPEGLSVAVINKFQTGTYCLQIAFHSSTGRTWTRVTRPGASSQDQLVYRDWVELARKSDLGTDLSKLSALLVGDSIAKAYRNSQKSYAGDIVGSLLNNGVSGARLSNTDPAKDPIYAQVTSGITIGGKAPDVIIADGGVNDYQNDIALGTVPDAPVTSESQLDLTTVCGGLQALFLRMIEYYPEAQRFFVAIHKVCRRDSGDVYYPTTANVAGWTQQDLYEAQIAICQLYGVKVVDVYKDGMINTAFDEYVSPESWVDADDTNRERITWAYYVENDGLHPLALGYQQCYTPMVREALRTATVKEATA